MKTRFEESNVRAVLAHYDLGDYVGFRGFERGADQTNLLVTTTQGSYVLRYYEKRTEAHAAAEIGLLHLLVGDDYPTAAPLADRAGSDFGSFRGKPYAMFAFCDGEHDDRPEHFRQVASAIAELHRITQGRRFDDPAARPRPDVRYCRASATESAGRMADSVEAGKRLAALESELADVRLPTELPVGICHGDPNPTNFLYRDGDLCAVLDFDQAAEAPLVYDIALLLYWWTWPDDGELDVAASRDLLGAYESVRPLTGAERSHLFDALKLVLLISTAWFLDDDAAYANGMRKMRLLNVGSRDDFHRRLCPAA